MNVFVVSIWLQHRGLVPDKHRAHFPVLERILIFLTSWFLIHVPPIISFRFLFLLKAVIRSSWNNSRRFLLVWRMFQFLRTTAVRLVKIYYTLFFITTSKFCLRLAVLNIFSFLRLKCSEFVLISPTEPCNATKKNVRLSTIKTHFHFFHSFSFKQRT